MHLQVLPHWVLASLSNHLSPTAILLWAIALVSKTLAHSIPTRLTASEESDLIRKGQAGDTDARNKVITNILGMIWQSALRYTVDQDRAEEYVNTAIAKLCETFQNFDLSRGVRYSTYAMWWVEQAMQRHYENGWRLIHIPPRSKYPREAKQSTNLRAITAELGACLAAREPEEDRTEEINQVRVALSKMRPLLAEILMRRANGDTLRVIGQEKGYTRERIRQLQEMAMQNLRELMRE